MDRALPHAAEPSLPRSGEGGTLRRLCYASLAVMVAAGAWVRFSDRIAELAPGLAAPGSIAPQPDRARGLIELGLTPVADSAAAASALRLPQADEAALQRALGERRVRLVRLPVFGASGGTVRVSSAGLTEVVRLSADPVVLTLPIDRVGTVTFRLLGAAPPVPASTAPGTLRIGAVTLNGPVLLPPIGAGDVLQVGVVAQ